MTAILVKGTINTVSNMWLGSGGDEGTAPNVSLCALFQYRVIHLHTALDCFYFSTL